MATRPPPRPPRPPAAPVAGGRTRRERLAAWTRRPWARRLLWSAAALGAVTFLTLVYFWASYARLIDARLGGEARAVPRIFGRPFELVAGRGLSVDQFVQRLNDVGYAQRPKAAQPGEFAVQPASVTVVTRAADRTPSRAVRVDFTRGASPVVTRIVDASGRPAAPLVLEAPLLAALAPGQKRRIVALASLPRHVVDAVLAIEDRRFYDHPGIDPIRIVGALITNIRGDKPYLVGGSTLTQQIVKNTFLTPEKTPQRKLQEQFMAIVLETRLTKDQILELYLNDVVLGQRGPFAIHGVAEAARIFFAKDVRNLSVAEAATLAGLIQSPSRLNPFRHPERARERRNVVLNEMADAGFLARDVAARAAAEPVRVSARALENEAPYFVDYVAQIVDEQFAGLLRPDAAVDVYTTLDLHYQRLAQEAVAEGVARLDKLLARRKQVPAQVALVAVDPRTGEILALVGGREYSQTQYNRAVTIRRQPGSVFKPFVYLAAFEAQLEQGRSDLTPATIFLDEPTVFQDGENEYAPANYEDQYDGPLTVRRGLALSRNIVAIKVAEATGYGRVADLWKRVGVGAPARPFPSIALGVFEASPLDMAAAYTVFTNGGALRPLRALTRIAEGGRVTPVPPGRLRPVASPEPTFLVTNMMRSVLNEGTGAAARGPEFRFQLDAAGKTGTTNELRDAWFAGFTPELLTVVWVGLDDNAPIGLSGSQAALPIWATFMRRALSGRPSVPFDVPEGVGFAEIDLDTGYLATPACPRVGPEAFLAGTEPREACPDHGGGAIARLRRWLGRIGR